jgi:hypothetical protein
VCVCVCVYLCVCVCVCVCGVFMHFTNPQLCIQLMALSACFCKFCARSVRTIACHRIVSCSRQDTFAQTSRGGSNGRSHEALEHKNHHRSAQDSGMVPMVCKECGGSGKVLREDSKETMPLAKLQSCVAGTVRPR